MAYTKSHNVVRILFKLLLMISIIQQNVGVPTTPLPFNAFTAELSSPAPFSTAAPMSSSTITIKAIMTSKLPTILVEAESPELLAEDDNVTDNSDNGQSTEESNTSTAAANVPNSVEQHDQPLPQVPPTTLSFANVVDVNDTATTQAHAVPPFSAVDDNYGK